MPFKKILKNIGYVLLGFTGLLALYLLLAVVLSAISVNKNLAPSNNVAIYMITNGDHVDIVVPVKNNLKDWSKELKYNNTKGKDTTAGYVAIGWGNKDFFLNTPTWAQFKLSYGIKAILGLGPAAIHAEFCKTILENDRSKKITMRYDQYARLAAYIDNSLKRDTKGQVIYITNAGYDACDAFYEAKGKYTLFYTCNTWANNALKACGQRACLWTPFDKGLFYQYRDRD
jgi:uncharacterized protein (TIGR02117 family)